jgi:hypothetical protein
LNVERSAPRGAVFLSYASQDCAAARKICEALRTAGLEVWFDQSELVGGDAWDQKIRKQIKECALFVPVISANSQAREEGYFRREWNLAVARTLDMADDKAFLVPVVIDDTVDATARVPEKFREVQWTRIRGGEAGPAFSERVSRLLNGPEGSSSNTAFGTRAGTAFTEPGLPRGSSRIWIGIAAAIVVAVGGLLCFWYQAVGYTHEQPGTQIAKLRTEGFGRGQITGGASVHQYERRRGEYVLLRRNSRGRSNQPGAHP